MFTSTVEKEQHRKLELVRLEKPKFCKSSIILKEFLLLSQGFTSIPTTTIQTAQTALAGQLRRELAASSSYGP